MPEGESRRDFLADLAMVVTIVPGAGVLAHHVLRFLIPPPETRQEKALLAKLADLPVGSGRLFKGVHGNDLIAVRLGEKDVKVFSSICTHLGCHVQWDAQAKNFLCPCHMGRFDTSGKVISGPPPAPLPAFPTKVDGESVFVVVPAKEAQG
jgi:Rieske Fe-S protein